MAAKVFLSYSHKDGEFAAKLHERLKADGVEVFYDKESIGWGANWVLAIEEALETCEFIVLVLSPGFLHSEWANSVERIVSTIEDPAGRKRRIRPLLCRECEKLPGLLRPIQYLDVRTDELFEAEYPKIRDAFGGKPPDRAPIDLTKLPPVQPLPPGSNLPHRSLGSRFVGRVEDLWAVRDLLVEQDTAIVQGVGVVCGTGGLGKTQLAVEYGYRFAPQYPGGVLWADAEQGRGAVLTQLSGAKKIDIDGAQEEDQQMLQLWQAMAGQPTLVILDNFPEEESLEPYLPRAGRVQALVTTRRRDLDGYKPLRLDFLSEPAALELLNSGDGRTFASEDAKPLLEALGGLPLALEIARALLNVRRDLSPADLAEDLARMGAMRALEVFADEYRNELPTEHELSVAATFQVSWNLLDESAKKLLRALADLAPVAVPMRLLRKIIPNESGSARKDPLGKGLAALHRLSLIEREPGTNDPVVHRLVQAFARGALPENALFQPLVAAIHAEMNRATCPISDLAAFEQLETVAPHAWLLAHDERADPVQRGAILDQIGTHHVPHGRYRQGAAALREALRIYQENLGPDHPKVATCQSDLAETLRNLRELHEAELLLRSALASDIHRFGSSHPTVAIRQSNLGLVLRDLGDLDGACKLMRSALATGLETLGATHPTVASRQSNLALVHRDLGDLSESCGLLRSALQTDLECFEPDHPRIAICQGNLAMVLADLGQLDEARVLIRQAHEAFLQKLGADHPHTKRWAGHMQELGLEPPAE